MPQAKKFLSWQGALSFLFAKRKRFIKIQSNEHQGNTEEEDSLQSLEITSRRALGPESTLKLPQNLCLRD